MDLTPEVFIVSWKWVQYYFQQADVLANLSKEAWLIFDDQNSYLDLEAYPDLSLICLQFLKSLKEFI